MNDAILIAQFIGVGLLAVLNIRFFKNSLKAKRILEQAKQALALAQSASYLEWLINSAEEQAKLELLSYSQINDLKRILEREERRRGIINVKF